MNDYIINPMWFYFMGLFDKIHHASWIGFVALSVSSIVCGVIYVDAYIYKYENLKQIEKMLKKIVVSAVLAIILFTITPSEQTIIKMIIAKNVTHTSIDNTISNLKEAVDYIFLKMREYKE